MTKIRKRQLNLGRSRIMLAFTIFIVAVILLCLRVAYIQVVKHDEYKKMAIERQKRDIVLSPTRGKILDTNGETLAMNVDTFTVWVQKAELSQVRQTKTGKERAADAKKTKSERYDDNVQTLAKLIDKTPEELKKLLSESDYTIVKVAQNLDKDKADKISDMRVPGVSVSDDTRRYYPMGDFLSHTIGNTRDDNQGLSGIELEYNHYLAGVQGRWLKNTDTGGNPLASGDEKYYKPEDGYDVSLTIDQTIQSYTEKSVRETKEKHKAERVSCIVMNTKTGEILSMASYPSFDPNNSRTPNIPSQKEEFDKLSEEEKGKYLNEMWRNPFFSNVYEPGSTMKLVTVAAALEEGITHKDDTFYCEGFYEVTGVKVNCWAFRNPHGKQTLEQGVGNSCNPVFMELALRLGKEKFYAYQNLFGMTEDTGIDFPGEASPIILDKNDTRPVDLAIMGMGQTSAVTPIQLVTAVSAMGNDGKLMQPHILKKVTDKDGNIVEENKPTIVRQAISKETADEMKGLMKYVVDNATGRKAQVLGYSVGGKTGTSEVPSEKGGYSSDIIASFIGMAPMEDPQFTILYIVERPATGAQGGEAAAPATSKLLEQILKYKNIKPTDVEKLNQEKVTVVSTPDVSGLKLSEAKKIVESKGLKYKVTPKADDDKDFVIKDQYPKAGSEINQNGIVYFYRE